MPKFWHFKHHHDEPVPSTVGLNLSRCVGLRNITVLPGRYVYLFHPNWPVLAGSHPARGEFYLANPTYDIETQAIMEQVQPV